MNPAVRQLLLGGGLSQQDRKIAASLYQRIVSPGRIAGFIGDSITNGSSASNVVYAYPKQTAALTGTLQFSYTSAVVAGVPGERSDQILSRLPAVLASGVRTLFILAGTNDAGQSVDAGTYATNMAAMLSACQSASVRCFVGTVPPRSSAVATSTTRTLTSQYNAWINANASTYGATVIDFWTALKDGADDLDSSYDSGDGIHPNTLGHRRMAQAAVTAVLAAGISQAGVITEASALNLVTNPLMTGTSARPTGYFEQPGGTGTAPTYSIVNDSSGFLDAGRWAEMDFDAVSGGQRTLACALSSKWSTGDTLAITGKAQIVDVGGNWESSYVAGTATFSFNVTTQSGSSLTSGAQLTAGLNIGPVCIVFTVPSTATSLALWSMVTLPTGAHIKARIGAMGVLNLTRMGLAGTIT